MMRSSIAVLLAMVCAACVAPHLSPADQGRARQPNIVVLLVDDMGWSQTSLPSPVDGKRSKFYETPALEALAASGMTFTSAYSAAAICSPTRAALMTGKHPARLHLTDYIPGNRETDTALAEPDWQRFLPLYEETLAEVLGRAGYRTALFGKWHLDPQHSPLDQAHFKPQAHGFDEALVTYDPKPHQAREWQTPEGDGHNTDLITKLSIDFIARNADHPFLIVVSYNAIHDPLMERATTIARYEAKQGRRPTDHPVLAAMVERLDRSIARIDAALGEHGLENDTILVFTSDNGGALRFARQDPFRAGKGALYEGGIRVPLIIRWPGVTAPGAHSAALALTHDLFTTLTAAAGIAPVAGTDGIDLASALAGHSGERRTAYWHYPHYHALLEMRPASAMRHGRYKLVERHETGAAELFDLAVDPSERFDRAEAEPKRTAQMRRELARWRQATGAQMPQARQAIVVGQAPY